MSTEQAKAPDWLARRTAPGAEGHPPNSSRRVAKAVPGKHVVATTSVLPGRSTAKTKRASPEGLPAKLGARAVLPDAVPPHATTPKEHALGEGLGDGAGVVREGPGEGRGVGT